jgi:hypothetical protein
MSIPLASLSTHTRRTESRDCLGQSTNVYAFIYRLPSFLAHCLSHVKLKLQRPTRRRASCHVGVGVVKRWNDVAYVRAGPMQCLVLLATCRRTRYPNLHYLQHRHVWHDTLNLFYALTGRSGVPSSTELVWCMHSFYEVNLCLVEGVRGIRELTRDEGASLID